MGISKTVHDALSVSVCTTPLSRIMRKSFFDNMELHLYETWELHAEILSFKRTPVGISSRKRSLFVDTVLILVSDRLQEV